MNRLKDLFDEERKRVFTPGPFFTERVLARLRTGGLQEIGIWEVVPNSTRPVFAVALMLILGFLAVEFWIPQMPRRGQIEAYLEPEQNPAESFLYTESEAPSRELLEQQLIALEGPQ
jgi:hypothetical protein